MSPRPPPPALSARAAARQVENTWKVVALNDERRGLAASARNARRAQWCSQLRNSIEGLARGARSLGPAREEAQRLRAETENLRSQLEKSEAARHRLEEEAEQTMQALTRVLQGAGAAPTATRAAAGGRAPLSLAAELAEKLLRAQEAASTAAAGEAAARADAAFGAQTAKEARAGEAAARAEAQEAQGALREARAELHEAQGALREARAGLQESQGAMREAQAAVLGMAAMRQEVAR